MSALIVKEIEMWQIEIKRHASKYSSERIKYFKLMNMQAILFGMCDLTLKSKVGSLPSHQLLWFLASIYLYPGFEPLISQR